MFGYALPPTVMTPEATRAAANRQALIDDGLTETPVVTAVAPNVLVARLEAVDRGRLMTAAIRARRAFPGPVGDLVARELSTWADLGFRFGGDATIAKLVTAIEAIQLDDLPTAA